MSKGDFENKINPTTTKRSTISYQSAAINHSCFLAKYVWEDKKIKIKFKQSFGQSYGGLLRNSSEQMVVKKELKISSSDLKTQHEKSKPN
jgi:hypothetical protein